MSYPIDQVLCSKNGYFTPQEALNYYGKYNRHGITWHWWGDNTGASNHDNIVNFIYNGSVSGTRSVNYVLSDNKITMMVGPDNVAWTSQNGNATTMSVELQPTLGGEGYKKAGWLASELAARYGGDRAYYPHNYWYSTQCPGTISLDRIRQEEDKWQRGEYSGNVPTPPAQTWNFVAKAGKAKVTGTGGDGLWVLKSPQLSGQTVTTVPEGTLMDFVGYVTNGDDVEGNRTWWKNQYGNYFSARYAPEFVAPAPTPAPTPPPPIPVPIDPVTTPVTPTVMYTLANAKVVNIKDMSVIKTFPIDTPIDVAGECTWTGNKFYLTKWAMDNKKLQGFLVGDLKPKPEPVPEPPKPEDPEWVKNLRDIDDTEFWIKEDTKLIDITTGKPALVNGAELTLEKDDSFVCSALTVVGSTEYRITDYSFKKGVFNGVPTDRLTLTPPGVPDIPPVPVNPPSDPILTQILELLKKLAAFLGLK